ncbi:hypothetical protein CC2G_014953 [Coprinopsis cinerea AmutBmut pab1-1]|nr:hypothetical protein CC2G_014953 [Coprinopsis cinerea AmutBmut pab1-1]
MVSAENLNFDVLDLIFSYLSGQDLASIALVSRTFLAGVLPSLYRNVWFRLREGKAYAAGQVISPFAVILKHPNLGAYVRSIDIESVPYSISNHITRQPHPTFMRECAKAMAQCRNLMTFKCSLPNVVPSFLTSLQSKQRLTTLRIYASLTTEQTRLLSKIQGVENLVLEFASWNVIDALPRWVENGLSKSLRSLAFYMTNELNTETLERILEQVPELEGLHVMSCARVDHAATLKLLKYTPELEHLSMSVTENIGALPLLPPTLSNLRSLCIDAKYSRANSPVPGILQTILDYFKGSACQLSSFSLKMPDRKIGVGHPFVKNLLEMFGSSLKRMAFIDCHLEFESLRLMSKKCVQLERLTVVVPPKDIVGLLPCLCDPRC